MRVSAAEFVRMTPEQQKFVTHIDMHLDREAERVRPRIVDQDLEAKDRAQDYPKGGFND